MHMQIEKTKHTDLTPTMAVNAYGDLWWNKEFVDSMDNDELKFCLAHEVGHIATLTFQREGKRDRSLWNIATDLVINYMLIDEGFRAPKNILTPDHRGIYTFSSGKNGKTVSIDLNDKNAEQVYEELCKDAKVIKEILNVTSGGGYDGSIDKHLQGGKDENGGNDKEKSEGHAKANENDWKRKAIEGATQAKMRGTISSSMERMLDAMLEPVIDWRSKLFAYITNDLPVDYTMRLPSRRFLSTGTYTPTVVRENLQLIVGVDISGSIGHDEYIEFMSEVLGIANSYRQVKMRVIGWACAVDERDDIEVTNDTQELLLKNKFYGGGGTTLTCLTEYINHKEYRTKLLVILTDGCIENTPKLPDNVDCLFVLSKNGDSNIVKNYGEVTSLNNIKR